jgi:hypothetical protein
MPRRSRWKEHAAAVIRRVMAEAAAAGLDAEATRRLVDAAYPFGARANHPYAMWLRARRELLFGDGVPADRAAAVEQERLAAWNQGAPIRDEGPTPTMGGE